MDAPLCKLCEKRHYGACANPVVPSEPKARRKAKKPASPKKNPKPAVPGIALSELLARVESLESRVEQLESRKRYQRDLMRKRRAEEKGDV